MKPKYITHAKPSTNRSVNGLFNTLAKPVKASVGLGDVNPMAVELDNSIISDLLAIGKEKEGLKYKHNVHYTSPSILLLEGSVGPHDDPGLGKLLNWVLKVSPLKKNRYSISGPELVVNNQSIELREGSVFLFDANKPHAWVSNDIVLLAQVTVSMPRRKASA